MMARANPKRKSLLYIDDDFHDIEFLKYFLTSSAVDVDVVGMEDGFEALKYLRNIDPYENAERPDMIFLDLNMPKKDGRDVLRDLKLNPDLKRIPVVIFTSSDSKPDINRCYEEGADYFLTKPVGADGYAPVIKMLQEKFPEIVRGIR